MVADIFYPIFTLRITMLAYFIQKKKKNGGLTPTRASLCTPWWAYSSPLRKKMIRPYFFWIIPWQHIVVTSYWTFIVVGPVIYVTACSCVSFKSS